MARRNKDIPREAFLDAVALVARFFAASLYDHDDSAKEPVVFDQSPNDNLATEMLTRAEAARMFKVTPSTIDRWANTGKIARVREEGTHPRFRKSDLERHTRRSD